MVKHTKTKEEMWALGEEWVKGIVPKEGKATVVALSGDLGAGKTCFTQGVARALGVTAHVTSPTFVLMKRYALTGEREKGKGKRSEDDEPFTFHLSPFTSLVHIDAYRFSSGKDMTPLRFDELLADPMNLIMIEWPELVADALPDDIIRIKFSVEGDGRKVEFL